MKTWHSRGRERGQILVMMVLALVVVCGFVSLTIDIGIFLHGRRSVQNAVDAGALAGAQELPSSGNSAESIARAYASQNDDELNGTNTDVTFRCIVGDRDHNGVPDTGDVPTVCNPGAETFHCSNGICWSYCTFNGANKCNTIVVGASKDVPFYFGPVLGVLGSTGCFLDECNTGAIRAAACKGACGGAPGEPLDMMMIIDRTSSMSAADLANAKAGATSVLNIFNPSLQHVGLGTIGAGNPGSVCNHLDPTSGGNWSMVPLSSNYKTSGGALNNGSSLVSTTNCLNFSSSQGTNIGSPIYDEAYGRLDAMDSLQSGRPDAKDAILLMTDGKATSPDISPVPGNTGNRNCSANSAVTSGSGDNNGFQTSPGNACADGSGNATDTDSGTNTNTSCTDAGKDRHIFRDYNVSLPANATIVGINVRLDAWADAASGTRRMCAQLSWNGGASWTAAQQTSDLSTSQATYNLGGSANTWGRSWVANDVTNANFQLRVTNVGSSTSRDFMLDWAAVNVYYTTPGFPQGPCEYANDQASFAKGADVEIFTIGFGIEGDNCAEPGSPYDGQPASELLADVATDSLDDHGHCLTAGARAAENADGDHFLCEARSGDLEPIFLAAAQTLASGSKLVPVFD